MNNYNEIRRHIYWFKSIFDDILTQEGFQFDLGFYTGKSKFKHNIGKYKLIPFSPEISQEQANQIAKEYGFILDQNDFIIDFKLENLTRNKHILTAKELNLL